MNKTHIFFTKANEDGVEVLIHWAEEEENVDRILSEEGTISFVTTKDFETFRVSNPCSLAIDLREDAIFVGWIDSDGSRIGRLVDRNDHHAAVDVFEDDEPGEAEERLLKAKEVWEARWQDETELTCSDCPDDECTGHCMSCPYM